MSSESAPAISTPVGPPPTTTNVSSARRRAGSAPSIAYSKPRSPWFRMRRAPGVACSAHARRPQAAETGPDDDDGGLYRGHSDSDRIARSLSGPPRRVVPDGVVGIEQHVGPLPAGCPET